MDPCHLCGRDISADERPRLKFTNSRIALCCEQVEACIARANRAARQRAQPQPAPATPTSHHELVIERARALVRRIERAAFNRNADGQTVRVEALYRSDEYRALRDALATHTTEEDACLMKP